jgi:hypothetical protein
MLLIVLIFAAYLLGKGKDDMSVPNISPTNQASVTNTNTPNTKKQNTTGIQNPDMETVNPSLYKVVKRDNFTFQSPQDWQESYVVLDINCNHTSISNPNGDGHRMPGEIVVQKLGCFKETNSAGYKEKIEKDEYVILAYYGEDVGTTKGEIALTQQVFQMVVDTFKTE